MFGFLDRIFGIGLILLTIIGLLLVVLIVIFLFADLIEKITRKSFTAEDSAATLGGCLAFLFLTFLFSSCSISGSTISGFRIFTNFLKEGLFGTGEIMFSVAFARLSALISSWGAHPFVAAMVSLVSFLAWLIGLVSGTLAILEFIKKRREDQKRR